MGDCRFDVKTCKCANCERNAAIEGCDHGFCINCYECEQRQEAVHNVYMCTSYEEKEKAKKEDDYMSFSDAIKAVHMGLRIRRAGWNGKNQYVEMATCISYKNAAGEIVNCEHEAIGNKALAFVGTSGVQMGWLASQADMLADDWEIIAAK